MRASLPVLAVLAACCLIGCWASHERGGGRARDGGARVPDAGICVEATMMPEGAPCEGSWRCESGGGCCLSTTSCRDGRVRHERSCAPVCWRTCEAALAGARAGDPCEGSFFCSEFDDDFCCSHSVSCVASAVVVEDACDPACE